MGKPKVRHNRTSKKGKVFPAGRGGAKPTTLKGIPTSLRDDYLEAYGYDTWSVTDEGIYDAYGVIHPELTEDEILEMNPTDMREELIDNEYEKVSKGKVSAKEMKDYIASIKEAWGWKRGMETP